MKEVEQFLQKPWLYVISVRIGVSLKFYKLENRYFWYDEISTIGHTSGNQIFYSPANEIKNISFFKDQLHLKTQQLTLGSQLKGLYNSTNLNPLHYTFLMVWYRVAGDNDMSYRYFNVLIFILTLPVLFLLAKTLFSSNLAGWMTVTFYSVSPYFHYSVNEARYNILLVFLISLFHYLFLLAINQKKPKWWIVYSLTGILALYASVLSGIILFGHAMYVLLVKRKIWLIYSINLLIILSAYIPWIVSMINHRTEITDSLAWHAYWGGNPDFLKLVLAQFIGFAKVFIIMANRFEYLRFLVLNEANGSLIQLVVDVILIIIILLSIIYTLRKCPAHIWLFLVCIIVPHILFYLISDLVRKTGGSFIWRYHAFCFVGILLFTSYLFYKKTEIGKLFYSLLYIILIIIGLISILYISKDRCYLVPYQCEENINEARIFSEAARPLLISDYTLPGDLSTGGFFAILNECESESIDVFHVTPDIKNVEDMLSGTDYSDIYVSHSSEYLIKNLKLQFGEKMDSMENEDISPMWTIKLK